VWEDNGVHTQADILAFDQVCEYDDAQSMMGANPLFGKKGRQ
jgi:hypothetical protein